MATFGPVTAPPSAIEEGDLICAFADIRSGSLDLLQRGLVSLRYLSQAPTEKLGPLITRLAEEGMIEDLLDMLRCGAMPSDISHDITWVFLNVAYPTDGCEALLSHNVPHQLLDMYDFSVVSHEATKVIENVLWLVGNIAGESGSVVRRLIDSGIYAKCLEILALIAAHPAQAQKEVIDLTAWLFANLFRHKPQLPFSVSCLALPHINSLLHTLDPTSAQKALADLAICCQFIFAESAEGVDYTFLHRSGMLTRLLALSRTGVAIRAVVGLLGDAAAHDSSKITRLIINDAVFDWIATVATLPGLPKRFQTDLLWLLSNIAADKSNLRDEFVRRRLFGYILQRATPRLRAPRVSRLLQHIVREASWVVHNLLSEPHSAAVPPALLQAGAVEFITAALANPAIYDSPRAEETVKRLTECVAMLIHTGSTERDEAYIEHGGPPSNEYLAAFCAAGAGAVLMTAINTDLAPSRFVVRMFSSLIGPMVGTNEPANADGGVPAAYLSLLDLRAAPAEGELPDELGENTGNE